MFPTPPTTTLRLDRSQLRLHPLELRPNRVRAETDFYRLDAAGPVLTSAQLAIIADMAARIRRARSRGKPVILAFGAHTIKNGLAPLLIELMQRKWVTLLATNGAGVIHDWEFAYQGASSEDVRAHVADGRFGLWDETGRYLNLAILCGAGAGIGYGESVGQLIETESLFLPAADTLLETIGHAGDSATAAFRAAAAADLLEVIRRFDLPTGRWQVPHPHKVYSAQAAAYRLGIPFTAHPMIGHDIIYTHPYNRCAAIGRTAEQDFLTFAGQVADIEHGVYLSVGSAVMSPMIFEKSMSMAQNLAHQRGTPIRDPFIGVVDLAESGWDWSQGEPPQDSPEYYLRACKSFARMGGRMVYLSMDNRIFLPALYHALRELD